MSKYKPAVITVGWEGDSPTSSGRQLIPRKKQNKSNGEAEIRLEIVPTTRRRAPNEDENNIIGTPPLLKGLVRGSQVIRRPSGQWESTPPSQRESAREAAAQKEALLNSLRTRLQSKVSDPLTSAQTQELPRAVENAAKDICNRRNQSSQESDDSFLASEEVWAATQAAVAAEFPPSPVVKKTKLTLEKLRETDMTSKALSSPPIAESTRMFEWKTPSTRDLKVSPMSNSTPQLLRSSVRAYKLRLSNDCLTAEVNNETKTVAADSFEDSQTDFLLANMELPGEILHSQPTADTLSTSTKENTNESDSDDEFCDPDFLAQIDEAVAGTA